ncbi:unnamed protein product [Cuscuta europaea]|uniref:Uncharacterized protein n=1 Tax=Cuscuta europaea TaxID=41803 RepID=A0A9P1DXE0_CUSEU|nr:unnamed protein product [Cuscuta europaea]
MGNLQRNRSKEIARDHPSGRSGQSKGKRQVGATSSSQIRDDWAADYNRRDAMVVEQLQQLLDQNQGRFLHQENLPEINEESEDNDSEKDQGSDGNAGHQVGGPEDEQSDGDNPDEEEQAGGVGSS